MSKQEPPTTATPDYVKSLQAVYGAPSQAAFGSAVFFEQLSATDDLNKAALAKYKFFVGKLWDQYGEAAWMGPWKLTYSRKPDTNHDIIAELRAIPERTVAGAVELILDNVEQPVQGHTALATAYDAPDVAELAVFEVGDGAAMSGLLIAGCRKISGETTFLVFLMD